MEKIINAIVSVISKIADTPIRGYAVIVKNNSITFFKDGKQYIISVNEIDGSGNCYCGKDDNRNDKGVNHSYYPS